jgi:tRNA (adenine57-N1/adenine58-N1)-methyltransferase
MISDHAIALIVDDAGKEHLVTVQAGKKFETHHGFILYDAIIGRPWGCLAHSSLGRPYLVLSPGMADLIRHIKRSSQVIFPKDSAAILMRLNVKPGARVLESGCGSGGLTLALAQAVAPAGRVYSQEIREDFIALTRRNLQKVGLEPYVTLIHGDATQGFQVDEPVDAVFIDIPEPWTCLTQARAALKDGGFFGSLVPTTNQVQELLRGLERLPFGMVEVEEILERGYKPVADRLRPRDRMIAHTGYLVFARAVLEPHRILTRRELSHLSRVQASGATADAPDAPDADDADFTAGDDSVPLVGGE